MNRTLLAIAVGGFMLTGCFGHKKVAPVKPAPVKVVAPKAEPKKVEAPKVAPVAPKVEAPKAK